MRHDRIDPERTDVRAAEPPSTIRVRDRMTSPAVTIRWDEPVATAQTLMKRCNLRRLAVIDDEKHLVGVVTDADLREAVAEQPLDQRTEDLSAAPPTLIVGKVMTWDALTVSPELDIVDAARLMQQRKVAVLPVVERDQVIGILTETDLLGALVEVLKESRSPAAWGEGLEARMRRPFR